MTKFRVVVVGGGVTGAEGLLRLHRLGGDQLEITLVEPAAELRCRPLELAGTPGALAPTTVPIAVLVAQTGARWVRASLDWVDRTARVVHTVDGSSVPYDALLLALGARERPVAAPLSSLRGDDVRAWLPDITAGIDSGRVGSIVFWVPEGPTWPLPLYELAFQTARHVRAESRDVRLQLATADPWPLYAFGEQAGQLVAGRLEAAGVRVSVNSNLSIVDTEHVRLDPGQVLLRAEEIVSLPRLIGPNVRGIPGFAGDRFLHVDERCRVKETDGRIFAAGDATDLPVKQGGVGAQQADAAAAEIAWLAGLTPRPNPFRPVLRCALATGDAPLYFSAHLIAGQGWRAAAYTEPPWPTAEKVIAEELGPFLAGHGVGAAVVVGFDGSAAARAALEVAADEAVARRTVLRVLHISQAAASIRPADGWPLSRLEAEVATLRATRQASGRPPVVITAEVVNGEVIAELRRAAAGAALLVLGESVQHAPSDVVDSVVEACTHNPVAPLLVVPAPRADR